MTPLNLLIALFIGIAAGAISYGFQFVISITEQLRLGFPQIVLAMPILVVLTIVLKKKTLYYPYKIKDLYEMTEPKNFFWNRWKAFYHFIGASLSHLFGASVGREGVIVLTTTGFARFLNLNLNYWGPIAASIGFAAITGNKWVGLIFLIEMYPSQFSQKVWTFLGAWVAVLFLESLKFPHLLSSVVIPDSDSYLKRFLFVLILGMLVGYISRVYKKSYFFLSDFFTAKNIFWSMAAAAAIGFALHNELLRPLQSLGLDLVKHYSSGSLILHSDLQLIILKLVFTLFCVSLGFFGGEYVPLVVVGTGLGATAAQYFGENIVLGATLGAFSIFCGVTRLKWTAIVLCLSLMDISLAFWVYVFFSACMNFSGDTSIYLEPRQRKFNFANFQFRAFNPRDFN